MGLRGSGEGWGWAGHCKGSLGRQWGCLLPILPTHCPILKARAEDPIRGLWGRGGRCGRGPGVRGAGWGAGPRKQAPAAESAHQAAYRAAPLSAPGAGATPRGHVLAQDLQQGTQVAQHGVLQGEAADSRSERAGPGGRGWQGNWAWLWTGMQTYVAGVLRGEVLHGRDGALGDELPVGWGRLLLYHLRLHP